MKINQPSVAAIHDLSGVGKCSLTVVLPVLSVCAVETAVLPTAVLSTHTGGFQDFTYRDLTQDVLPIAQHWKSVGCEFNALYSGFLGSVDQIDLVKEIFTMFRKPGSLVMVDPVMGDNGKLYPTYTREMADGMKTLCECADIVVPNLTEACHILGLPYAEGPYTREFVREVLSGLCKLGPRMAVLTGVWYGDGGLGAAAMDGATGEISESFLPRIPGSFHGTGDLFSATLLGGLLNGMGLPQACALAVEYTHRTIVSTRELSKDYKFGPKFEMHLPWLGRKLEEHRNFLQKEGE